MAATTLPQDFRIGVISDTHGYLDPKIPHLFEGVSHILHAGDIGRSSIIFELENIAPTTAVVGNTDIGLGFRETEVIAVGGLTFLLQHIVDRHRLDQTLERRIHQTQPRAVVFGHTHHQCSEEINGCLFFNSGYSGTPKFNQARSVAILHCTGNQITAEYLPL